MVLHQSRISELFNGVKYYSYKAHLLIICAINIKSGKAQHIVTSCNISLKFEIFKKMKRTINMTRHISQKIPTTYYNNQQDPLRIEFKLFNTPSVGLKSINTK